MTTPPVRPEYDVIIAGARCAGGATALLLARRGFRVLVVDPLPRDRDVLSTHALMRGAVLQLHRWGLLDAILAAGTPAVRATTFVYDDETITIPIKERDGVAALYAPRRTVLDPVLADAAAAAGAHVVHGLSVTGLLRDRSGRVTGAWIGGPDGSRAAVRARLVIGADGVRSRVARLVGAPIEHAATHAAACVFGYWTDLPRDEYRWGFRGGAGTGLIPTNDNAACVFVSLPSARFAERIHGGIETVLHGILGASDPSLAHAVTRARAVSGLRAFAGLPGFLRRCAGPGWALVGDAGCFRDPITAHGITDALRDAELLARAVFRGHDGALIEYQAERDAVAREILDLSDRIAAYGWSGDEVKRLHHALSRAMNASVDLVRGFDSDSAVPDPPAAALAMR